MSNLAVIKDETIEVEVEDFDSVSNESKSKEILNQIILKIPTYTSTRWQDEFDHLAGRTQGGPPKVDVRKVYKVASIRALFKITQENGWRFAKSGNQIYIYNGEFWIEIDVENLKHFLKLATSKLGVPLWLAEEIVFINNLYDQFFLSGYFEQMIQPNETLLNLKNGTLRISLNGISLSEFRPTDFQTNQLDFEYDPSSKNQLWIDFLETVLPSKETRKTLQQALAYLFIQDLKLEKAIFLYGTGSNGKSVIYEVLDGLVSKELITHYDLESLCDAKGYHRTGIHNKLINYGTDIKMSKIDHGMFKQLISGEPVQVRQIYEKPFIMKKYAKLIFNLNRIDDADVETTIGFFRRMIFIPFELTIPPEKQDKTLHKKILANKSGVLNWILEGVEEVLKNEEIAISPQCTKFLENFKQESNLAFRFIDEVGIEATFEETMKFDTLYQLFVKFCNLKGEKSPSQRHFNGELKKLEFLSVRKNDGFYWFAKHKSTKSFFTPDPESVVREEE